ncbi:MAG: carboxypeptidase regulatory-like domain-containing protein [Planctomycetes bacterium]|nr:carboxypeptidase regulatory-like domain-containing protein [Planctomycetota bacterium]
MTRRTVRLVLTVLASVGVLALWWLRFERSESASAAQPESSAGPEAPRSGETGLAASSPRSTAEREPVSSEPRATNTPATSPRRVRLLDDATGEPVPHFGFTLRPGDLAASTDAAGWAELALRDDAACTLELSENTSGVPDRVLNWTGMARELATTVELPPASADHPSTELRIPVGPTYRLSISVPPEHALSELLIELCCADPSQRFDLASTALREPASPWVRFRASARAMRGAAPWQLQARTRDGLWFGSAEVESNVGIRREPVVLALESRARLHGYVRDALGAALSGGYVRIERDGASFSDASNTPLLGRVGDAGEYEIPCAVPGEYSVRFERDGFLPFRARVSLPAGRTTELDLALEKPPPSEVGRVLARIESSSGRFERAVYPYLRPAGTKSGSRRAEVVWTDEAGLRVGTLSFEDVPLGEYDLGIQVPGFVQVEPREQLVSVGGPTALFRIHDDVWKLLPLEIEAVDANDAALDEFRAQLSVQGAWGEVFDRVKSDHGRARFEAAPAGVRARLKVSKDGWQPLWLDVDLDAAQRNLRVALRPGWGIEVSVRGRDGAPLAGARVYFDDEFFGETDASGALNVAREQTPERARVEYSDWKPTANSRLDAEGRFRAFEPWLTVELAPPQ